MNELARTWIRRIAMGLPIAPLGAVVLVAGCNCPPVHERFAIDEAEAARIVLADHDAAACDAICNELEAGAVGVGADGGTGYTPPYHGSALDCDLEADGAMLIANCEWSGGCIGGRRPAGLSNALVAAPDETGAWLARMAWMEGASVAAFEELAQDLARFGAPRTLVAGAARAAIEERRHARVIGALAWARGAAPVPVRRRETSPRPLIGIAIDNAAEGGVRETYGALVAAFQAEHAGDRDVRIAMRGIARDEASHALLSDAIDRWARTRVDPSLLDRARASAARAMRTAVREDEVSSPSAARLGLPNANVRTALVSALS